MPLNIFRTSTHTFIVLVLICGLLILCAKPSHALEIEKTSDLHKQFVELNYRWQDIEQSVPAIILDRLPGDLNVSSVKVKKETFFMALLPIILLVNDEIRKLILQNANAAAIREVATKHGMSTLRDVGLQRVKEGITSIEEVLRVTSGH